MVVHDPLHLASGIIIIKKYLRNHTSREAELYELLQGSMNRGAFCSFAQKDTTYPVQNISPTFHGNALEDSKHGKKEVVKIGDSTIGSIPPATTFAIVYCAFPTVSRKSTR